MGLQCLELSHDARAELFQLLAKLVDLVQPKSQGLQFTILFLNRGLDYGQFRGLLLLGLRHESAHLGFELLDLGQDARVFGGLCRKFRFFLLFRGNG